MMYKIATLTATDTSVIIITTIEKNQAGNSHTADLELRELDGTVVGTYHYDDLTETTTFNQQFTCNVGQQYELYVDIDCPPPYTGEGYIIFTSDNGTLSSGFELNAFSCLTLDQLAVYLERIDIPFADEFTLCIDVCMTVQIKYTSNLQTVNLSFGPTISNESVFAFDPTVNQYNPTIILDEKYLSNGPTLSAGPLPLESGTAIVGNIGDFFDIFYADNLDNMLHSLVVDMASYTTILTEDEYQKYFDLKYIQDLGFKNDSAISTPVGFDVDIETPREWQAIGSDSDTRNMGYKLLNDIDFSTDTNWFNDPVPHFNGESETDFPLGSGVLKWNPKTEDDALLRATYNETTESWDVFLAYGYTHYIPNTPEEILAIENDEDFSHWGGVAQIGNYKDAKKTGIQLTTNNYKFKHVYMDGRVTATKYFAQSDYTELPSSSDVLAPIANTDCNFRITGDVIVEDATIMCGSNVAGFITTNYAADDNGSGSVVNTSNWTFKNCHVLTQTLGGMIMHNLSGMHMTGMITIDEDCKVMALCERYKGLYQGARIHLLGKCSGLKDTTHTSFLGIDKAIVHGELISAGSGAVAVIGVFNVANDLCTIRIQQIWSDANIRILGASRTDSNSNELWFGNVGFVLRMQMDGTGGAQYYLNDCYWGGKYYISDQYTENISGIVGRLGCQVDTEDNNSRVFFNRIINDSEVLNLDGTPYSGPANRFGGSELWQAGKESDGVVENMDDCDYLTWTDCLNNSDNWSVDFPSPIDPVTTKITNVTSAQLLLRETLVNNNYDLDHVWYMGQGAPRLRSHGIIEAEFTNYTEGRFSR